MKTTVEIINNTAIEAVCSGNSKPETSTEISMVNLFKEFGAKLVDELVKEKKFVIVDEPIRCNYCGSKKHTWVHCPKQIITAV